MYGFEAIWRRIRGAASSFGRRAAVGFRFGAFRTFVFGSDRAGRFVPRRVFVRLGVFFAVSSLAAGIGFHVAERWELSRAPEATRGAFLSALERGDPDAAASYAVTRDEEGHWHPVSREWGALLAAAYRSDPSYREWLSTHLAFRGETDEALPPPFSLVRVGRAFRVYLPALYVWVPEGGERASSGSQTGTFELLAGGEREGIAFPLPEVRPGRFGPFPPVSGELRYACPDLKDNSPEGGAAEPWFAVRRLTPERALEADAIVWWLGAPPGFDMRAPEVLEVAVRFAVSFDEALRKRDASLLEGTDAELRRLFSDMIAQGELPSGTPELRPRRIRLCPSAQNPRRVLDGAGGELLEADVEEEWENDIVVRWRYRFRREGDGSLAIVAAVRADAEAVSPLPRDGVGDFLPERPPAFGGRLQAGGERGESDADCLVRNTDLVYVIGFDGGVVPHRNDRDPQGEEALAVRRWAEAQGGVVRFRELPWPEGIAALRRGEIDGYFGAISPDEASRRLPGSPYVVLEAGGGRRTVLLLAPQR
ncbi:hypothetical protein [Brockia lithotrophica]|uniref:Uncharacterized protein n=1 Tax=Brockia lithotrophica TaxID=933949 RepID=A0A660L372_9BACL|nr:hypothetical protein [Brockia lithotrophica]RKQ88461.1 hypothetical protein C7438_0094 [Brockia lithotrophica]